MILYHVRNQHQDSTVVLIRTPETKGKSYRPQEKVGIGVSIFGWLVRSQLDMQCQLLVALQGVIEIVIAEKIKPVTRGLVGVGDLEGFVTRHPKAITNFVTQLLVCDIGWYPYRNTFAIKPHLHLHRRSLSIAHGGL